MSDSGSSYYEISLTSRQVLVAFVILLSCVVAAFFAGVWVGRNDRMVMEVGPSTAGIEEGAGEDGQASEVGELRFFTDAERSDRQIAEEEPPATERPREPVRQPPSRQSTTTAEPPAAAAGAGEAQALAGQFVIQVFSSTDRQQADRLVARLREGGYPVFVLSESVKGQTMYRVRIGPYEERSRAEAVAERVQRGFKLDTWITQ